MESFNNLKKIYNEVKQAADLSKMLLYVVGNKNDQYEHEQIKKNIAIQYSKSINATYRCVSALKSEGINELFDCIGRSLGRCTKFSWGTFGLIGEKECEECHCSKDSHKIDHYHWIKKSINKKKDNADKIREEKEKNQKEKERYIQELNSKKNAKSNLERQKNELNYNKNKLSQEKVNNINERNEIQKKILNTKNQITFIIVRLKNISNKISDIAMNNNHLKTEEEYIDSLQDNMKEVGIKDDEQKRLLQEQKNCIRIFRETNKLDDKELMGLSDSELAAKLHIIIPKSTKDKK